MSNYFNDAGEPLMDGAAMRYEMYLDSQDDYYDAWDDMSGRFDNEPAYVDPEDCDHGDWSSRGWSVECDSGCESTGMFIVKVDFDETEVEDFIVWNV